MDPQPGPWFQLLGSVRACHNGELLKLGGPKPRAVLAALLYRANRVLTTDELLALVWGSEAGVTRDSLYHCVGQIKAALAPAVGQVSLQGLRPNYQLTVAEPEQVIDWLRFCALVNDATSARNANDPDRARGLYRRALGLWQGEPLADIGDALSRFRHTMRSRRLHAAEGLAQLELQHGDPAQVVHLMGELCEQHPERELAAALLMRGLGALGRRDEAIAAYQRTQRHIARTLGLDPNGLLEQAYHSIVNDPPPVASRLALRAGLPRLEGYFVDRSVELDAICNVLAGRSSTGTAANEAVVCAIHGMAGSGKSQLALRAAHAVADRFPDGPLYIDLLGYRSEAQPLEPADALGRLLQSLGVPVEKIPHELDRRATVYRSALAGMKRLIILDNATTTSQIQPLLPAEPGCRVIITSRKRLATLDDAYVVRLGVLDPGPASELFAAVAGLPAEEQDATVTRIVAGCGQLPLAIRILAARYRSRSWSSLVELETHLADEHEKLRLLDDGERSITAAFTVSYQSLPDEQRRMFRLLGLIPGPESHVDAHDAASLTNVPISAAQHLLAQLAANGLLSQPTPGHYSFHDLLRTYASQLAWEESETDQRIALTRLFDHYCQVASRAMELYAPYESHRRPPTPPPTMSTPPLHDREQAQTWLDYHQRVLLSAARYTALNGLPSRATHLTQTLFRYLDTRVHAAEVLSLYNVVLHAARLTVDRAAEAHLLNDLAGVQSRYGRSEEALEHLEQALRIDREIGNRFGEARTLGNLASCYGRLGNHDVSITHHRHSVRLYIELGDHYSEMRGITNLCVVYLELARYDEAVELLLPTLSQRLDDKAGRGSALAILANGYRGLGRYDEAVLHHNEALTLLREVGDSFEEAETLNDLGRTLRDLHRYDEAQASHTEALTLASHTYNRMEQARAHEGLGHVNHALGLQRHAVEQWSQALTIYAELGMRNADEVRRQISQVVGDTSHG